MRIAGAETKTVGAEMRIAGAVEWKKAPKSKFQKTLEFKKKKTECSVLL